MERKMEKINEKRNKLELPYSYEVMLSNEQFIKSDLKDEITFELVDPTTFGSFEEGIINTEFDPLTSKADKIDYLGAATCGLLCATLNQFWLGKFSLLDAHKWGKDKTDSFVIQVAKIVGFKGDDLKSAIRFLEGKYPLAADKATSDFGGGLQHHFRDFTHHPTIAGLVFSIMTQFSGTAYGTNTAGEFISVAIEDASVIGKDFSEKIIFGTFKWAMHLISDMSGSSSSIGEGTGIPGPMLSFFKELSSSKLMQDISVQYKDGNISLSEALSKIFNGSYFTDPKTGERIRFDLRTEIGIFGHIAKGAVPVLINEIITRAFYMIRRIMMVVGEQNIISYREFREVNPELYLPINSRSLTRMLTVSSGVFFTVTTSATAINSAIKSKGNGHLFAGDFLLNINYFGIARFTLACVADYRFIIEDIKDLKAEYLNRQYAIYDNHDVEVLNYFTLSKDEYSILHSLQYHMCNYDIDKTKDEKDKLVKTHWRDEWSLLMFANNIAVQEKHKLLSEDEIYSSIQISIENNQSTTWLYIVLAELLTFTPYMVLDGSDSKLYKGINFKNSYLEDIFLKRQTIIQKNEFQKFTKEYNKSINTLKNTNQKLIVGIGATVASIVVTGGLAFAFAPQIAVALAGGSIATGLSGAALTSASLAAIGGGSLAAGGLGMAGGAAIIAGSGAVIGGISVATVTSAMILSSKEYTLQECSKILTISKEVLIDQKKDYKAVESLYKMTLKEIIDLNNEMEKVKASTDFNKTQIKKIISNSKASLDYLERCSKSLYSLL